VAVLNRRRPRHRLLPRHTAYEPQSENVQFSGYQPLEETPSPRPAPVAKAHSSNPFRFSDNQFEVEPERRSQTSARSRSSRAHAVPRRRPCRQGQRGERADRGWHAKKRRRSRRILGTQPTIRHDANPEEDLAAKDSAVGEPRRGPTNLKRKSRSGHAARRIGHDAAPEEDLAAKDSTAERTDGGGRRT